MELAKDLRALGNDVVYPGLPNADSPSKREWLATLSQVWGAIPCQNEKTVIAHSLRASMIATQALLEDFSSLPDGFDGPLWRLVGSDADPACVAGAAEYFGAEYGGDVDLIPMVLAWALDPEIRLAAR